MSAVAFTRSLHVALGIQDRGGGEISMLKKGGGGG